ncbi:MAG: D-2-hydroxyacid dehydrogenase family protein [Betaproteobacteria bacterium]|nr:D-2-hydroxyacid dehydrogenase family protein [Betaproteobacteria bacterium]
MRVAVLDDIHEAWDGSEGVRRLRERAEVRVFTAPFRDPAALRGFDALIANRERTRFSRALLQQLPDVRIVAQTGNHAYHVDFAAAAELGILFGRATGGFSHGAAELAIGLAMAVMRGIPAADAAMKRGEWPRPMTRVLHGKTMGIVGLGRIGRHVAKIADAFGMRVVAWSPRLTAEAAQASGAQRLDLDDLLGESDVVSIHLTLAPESRGLIDARRLALMKRTACLVNTARGPIVDEAALVAALREGRIAGAGLDVFDVEPLPAGHELARLPNVVLTPHIGWPTDEAYADFANAAADVLIAYMDGREVPRFVEHP